MINDRKEIDYTLLNAQEKSFQCSVFYFFKNGLRKIVNSSSVSGICQREINYCKDSDLLTEPSLPICGRLYICPVLEEACTDCPDAQRIFWIFSGYMGCSKMGRRGQGHLRPISFISIEIYPLVVLLPNFRVFLQYFTVKMKKTLCFCKELHCSYNCYFEEKWIIMFWLLCTYLEVLYLFITGTFLYCLCLNYFFLSFLQRPLLDSPKGCFWDRNFTVPYLSGWFYAGTGGTQDVCGFTIYV